MEEKVERPVDSLMRFIRIGYLDALYVKMRDNGHVQNRAVYVMNRLSKQF